MADETTPEEAEPRPVPEGQGPEGEQVPETPEDDTLAGIRREAAGYRVKLRETEQERVRLAGTVETMQRAEVERIATEGPIGGALADGQDLWRAGAELGGLLSEDGRVDAEKVQAAARAALEAHPHWGPPPVSMDGGVRQSLSGPPDFAESLRKAAGGGL